ncbi:MULTISPECIES: hypothetical protein [unclassified Mesorhizobium]|uniref:hypothetical protein n=1 Tax=unclassified Mesorhizobium TaxID=325217 RepID=UPI0013DFBD77|nr:MULTISPECIES: hypothetical protein [unclassified Mesorhizobium]
MDEHVRLPIALLDEAEAFRGVEKLHGSSSHTIFLSNRRKSSPPGCVPNVAVFEIEREDRQGAKAQKQRSFNKFDLKNIALNRSGDKAMRNNIIEGRCPESFRATNCA